MALSTTRLPSSWCFAHCHCYSPPLCLARRRSAISAFEIASHHLAHTRGSAAAQHSHLATGTRSRRHQLVHLTHSVHFTTVAMAAPRQSPFADQPFEVAASNTESMIEEWLKHRGLPDLPKVLPLRFVPDHVTERMCSLIPRR